jgi:outer membrane protein
MKSINTIAGLGVVGLTLSGSALADMTHKNEVRLGLYIVQYDAKARDISGPFVPPGLNVDVKDVNTGYFAFARTVGPHFVVELAFGVPPKTETVGKGPASVGSVPFNGEVLSTAKWFAPTLLANYVFRDESAALRPYLGFGLNFTHFYDRQSTAAGNAANGGPTAISLTNSVGPSATAGLSWRIQDRWSLYASYSITKVGSDYSGNTAGTVRRTHIDFNPSAWVLSAGYAF